MRVRGVGAGSAASYGRTSPAAAKRIAAGVIAECQKNNWNIAVAVVDTHGTLIYYEKMEDTQYASADIAIGKAKAAATYRRPTRVFAEVINKGSPATATLPGVFASPGGVPIMVGGKVIGRCRGGVTGEREYSVPGVAGLNARPEWRNYL